MSGYRLSDTKGTLYGEDSFCAKGSLDTEVSGTRQSKRLSDREAFGHTGAHESSDTEKPRACDRTSPADTGNDLDGVLEDTQPLDSAAEGLRRRYLLRRFWRSAAGFWGRGSRSA